MSSERPRPMCFVAMPFGKKPPAGQSSPMIDFDAIYGHIEQAVEGAGLECVRADYEPGGGFIHRPMYERLLVAEYVVADLTLANPNVTYEVGVRHGASARPTILIAAGGDFMGDLPFDLRPLRVLPYPLAEDGSLPDSAGRDLVDALGERLAQARRGELPVDNPIMQVTAWRAGGRLEHDKTDVFLSRMKYASELGERLADALDRSDAGEAIEALQKLEQELLGDPDVVAQLHSALVGIFLGYREKKAYPQMVDLVPRLPGELQRTAVVQEQLALALNRLAEQEAGDARELRRRALRTLDRMPEAQVTSETWGIRGRIYKGEYTAEMAAGDAVTARAKLGQAIEAYENGFRADLRDYYPGVNAVTLRLTSGRPEDHAALEQLLPTVRMAVDCAPEAASDEEVYWQRATKLELASAAKDWEAAEKWLERLLGPDSEEWMRETTAKNLKIQQQAFADDAETVEKLASLIGKVLPRQPK